MRQTPEISSRLASNLDRCSTAFIRRLGYGGRTCGSGSSQDFVANKMEANDLRGRGGLVVIAIHCLSHVGPQVLQGIGLGVNPGAQGRRGITSVNFILAYLKDDLAHGLKG